MKIKELMEAKGSKGSKGSPTDIVEFTAPYASDKESNIDADMAAAKFAWKFKCMTVCVDRHGPSGGWPEYTYWGPRAQMEKLAKEYNGPDSGESDEEVYSTLKKSRRSYQPISPVEAANKRKQEFQIAVEDVRNELTGPRGSVAHDVEVDDTGVTLTMAYDFPEHRPKLAELKKLLKPFNGNIRSEKNQQSSRAQPLYDYVIDFDDLTAAEARLLKQIFKKK